MLFGHNSQSFTAAAGGKMLYTFTEHPSSQSTNVHSQRLNSKYPGSFRRLGSKDFHQKQMETKSEQNYMFQTA